MHANWVKLILILLPGIISSRISTVASKTIKTWRRWTTILTLMMTTLKRRSVKKTIISVKTRIWCFFRPFSLRVEKSLIRSLPSQRLLQIRTKTNNIKQKYSHLKCLNSSSSKIVIGRIRTLKRVAGEKIMVMVQQYLHWQQRIQFRADP